MLTLKYLNEHSLRKNTKTPKLHKSFLHHKGDQNEFSQIPNFQITIKPLTQRDLVLKLTYITHISLQTPSTHQINVNRVKTISQTDLPKPRLLHHPPHREIASRDFNYYSHHSQQQKEIYGFLSGIIPHHKIAEKESQKCEPTKYPNSHDIKHSVTPRIYANRYTP